MNTKIRKLFFCCGCFWIAFTSIVSAEPKWNMKDVLAEIMTQHKKIMNYETSKGRPWKRVRDALIIQDLRSVEVYE
jgi:hypothetical protein